MVSLSYIQKLVRDYRRIRDSGVFMAEAYGRRYFGLRGLPPSLMIWHFIIFGERRGAWANPFFDATAVLEGTMPRLAPYLASDAINNISSRTFDDAWYRRNMPPNKNLNPLKHFWTVGFDQNLDPSPDFDCDFFRSVVACDVSDKRQHAYDRLATVALSDPVDEQDLIDRQIRFRGLIDVVTLAKSPTKKRPYLVFIQASHDTPINLIKADRSYDVLVNYYDQAPAVLSSAEYSFLQKGTKTTAIAKLVETEPELILAYQAVVFIDDDVDISIAGLNSLFETFTKHSLDLAQPALTADSETYYPDLKQPTAGSGVRFLTAVEIMAPILSRRALEACQWVFGESISGWGVDLLLAAEVRRLFGEESIALVADVVARHPRAVDVAEGAFYKFLASFGLDPHHEKGRIVWRHKLQTLGPAIKFSGA